jgi:hypothetical protein
MGARPADCPQPAAAANGQAGCAQMLPPTDPAGSRRTDIARQMIYHHFADKAAFFKAIRARLTETLIRLAAGRSLPPSAGHRGVSRKI